jgi:hypothetical protein
VPIKPRDILTTAEWRHSGQTLLRDMVVRPSLVCMGVS